MGPSSEEGKTVQGLRFLTIVGAAVVSLSSISSAQEPADAAEVQPMVSSILDRSSNRTYEVVTPSLGRGYVGYELPAVDSCPCCNDRCFNPCRYYFGGKPYIRSWRRRWLSAHLGHGSMLDAYPCQCLSPGLTHPFWRPVSPQEPK